MSLPQSCQTSSLGPSATEKNNDLKSCGLGLRLIEICASALSRRPIEKQERIFHENNPVDLRTPVAFPPTMHCVHGIDGLSRPPASLGHALRSLLCGEGLSGSFQGCIEICSADRSLQGCRRIDGSFSDHRILSERRDSKSESGHTASTQEKPPFCPGKSIDETTPASPGLRSRSEPG